MRRWLLAAAAVMACIVTAVPASAVSLSDIKGRGRVIVATSGNLPPNTFVDERNQLTGYDVEVAVWSRRPSACRSTSSASTGKASFRASRPAASTRLLKREHHRGAQAGVRLLGALLARGRGPARAQGRRRRKGLQGPRRANVGAISGGNDGEIPAREIEKQFGAFKSFKGYPGNAEMFADMRGRPHRRHHRARSRRGRLSQEIPE